MLRQGVFVLIVSLAMVNSASADDLRSRYGSIKDPPSAYRSPLWQGLYIGASGGYAWGDDNGGDIEVFEEDKKGKPHKFGKKGKKGKFEPGPHEYDLGLEGGFAGVQVGFNRRAGNFVFGLEADVQTNVDGGSTTSFSKSTYSVSQDVEWFGTLRGRVGYARDHLLIYATAGLAFGEVSYSGHLNTGSCCAGASADLKSSKFETGYVVGAGLERALGANWSLKFEYQYIDLGDGKAEGPLFSHKGKPSGDGKADFDTDFHTVRFGLNYRFHREQGPLK